METSATQIKALRKEAARRKRRIVFHSDGQVLERILAQAAGTQVDTCTYSLVHQFNLSRLYRTEVGQEWPPEGIQIDEEERDGLEIYLDFCSEHGFEAFWAMRMNDTHDAGDYEDARWKLANNRIKQEHPDWLTGAADHQPPHGRWTSVDYGWAEIREQAYRLWEDVARRYEIDGIMLDFYRHPTLFKSAAWGKEVSDAERASITDLMRRTRAMTDQIGAQRGRPILLAVRTPDSVGYCEGMGIELEKWMLQELIDIWIPSGYFRLQEWSESADLGHRYGVEVWASLDECRVETTLPQLTEVSGLREMGIHTDPKTMSRFSSVRTSLEAYRARFVNAVNAGADSAYLFNFQLSQLLDEAGDRDKLARLNKIYCPVFRGRKAMDAGYWLKGGDRFYTRPKALSPEDPHTLRDGQSLGVDLTVGDDLSSHTVGLFAPKATLCLQAEGLSDAGALGVTFNSTRLARTGFAEVWTTYSVDPRAVKMGSNRIEIEHDRESGSTLILHDLLLLIEYEQLS